MEKGVGYRIDAMAAGTSKISHIYRCFTVNVERLFLSGTIVVHLSAQSFSRIGIIPSSRQWRIRGTTVKISLGLNGVSMSFLTRLKRWVIFACRSRRPSGKNVFRIHLHNTELPKELFFREFYKFYFEGFNVQSGIHIIPISSTGFCFEDFLGETTATDAEIPAEAAEEERGLRANSIGFFVE